MAQEEAPDESAKTDFIEQIIVTGTASGTAIRKALGDIELDPKEKKKVFKGIFGHTKLYDMMELHVAGEISEQISISKKFAQKIQNLNF